MLIGGWKHKCTKFLYNLPYYSCLRHSQCKRPLKEILFFINTIDSTSWYSCLLGSSVRISRTRICQLYFFYKSSQDPSFWIPLTRFFFFTLQRSSQHHLRFLCHLRCQQSPPVRLQFYGALRALQ